MRQETIKIYTFKELNKEAQQKAIESYIENIDWSIESESISEDFKLTLGELGLPIEDVQWSLNNCQGDGVAFYGAIDEMEKVVARLLPEDIDMYNEIINDGWTIEAKINRINYHYNHYNTMEVEMNHDDIEDIIVGVYGAEDEESMYYDDCYKRVEDFIERLQDAIQQDVKDVSRQLEKDGYNIIDGIQDEGNVREYLEYSEYEYYENGKQYF